MTDRIERKQKQKTRHLLAAVILVGVLLGSFGGLLGWLNSEKPFPDGNPGNVTCKGSYTVSDGEAAAAGDTVVATVGAAQLTNRQLQIYYWMEVAAYTGENGPDLSVPLDQQLCPADSMALTWQQYFLQEALETWHRRQALNQQAQESGYIPGQSHQDYLDTLALQLGEDPALLDYADLLNRSYMYFADRYHETVPDQEEVDAFLAANPDGYADGYEVDIRYILLTPSGETEEDWDACMELAEDFLMNWAELAWREHYFTQFAIDHSQDASAASGGLYIGLRPETMDPAFREWCFDPAREAGDYTLIQTETGIHLLYYRGRQELCTVDAEGELTEQAAISRIMAAEEQYPMTVDYTAVVLGKTNRWDVTDEALLYPDVAHEYMTEVPWYFQNDYPDVRYGRRTVAEGGCGLTCFTMVATYMTDTEQSIVALGSQMRRYSVASGTAWAMFDEGPATVGFSMPRRSKSIDEVVEALENGQLVVSIQREGLFTTRGHYILLAGITEDGKILVHDPDRVTVRSSDPRLVEGFANGFEPRQVDVASRQYFIFDAKQLTDPACARCGNGGDTQLLTQDYYCQKCLEADTRRQMYLNYFG